jgi:hypothetical protein
MLEYALLESQDTPLLVNLVRDCYGDNYAHSYFYDANALRLLLEQRMLFCAVAYESDVNFNRRIVAHMAVKLDYAGDRTADNFAGMMLPEYRGKGVLMQLGAVLYPVYESLQLLGLQTSTVTHHSISQKISSKTGTVSCGCLLADSPGSNADGLQIATRMPIIMQFYKFQRLPPRQCYLPDCYQALVSKIFRQLDAPLSFITTDNTPSRATSTVEQQVDNLRGTALLRFHAVGEDATYLLDQFLATTSSLHAAYVDMPLTDPGANKLIGAANRHGWFFGGIVFERANTDFLRLQRCKIPPMSTRDGIVDDFSRELVEDILQDNERINA